VPRRPSGKRGKADGGSWVVHGRAANGEGSIYPRSDGRWTATFRDATGRTRTVSARTGELVLSKRAAALADARNQAPTRFDRSTTVGALADWWLANVASTQVRPSSLAKYADRVARIKGGLGSTSVADLRPEQVQAWLTGLQREGLSASTAADTRLTLRQVLSVGVGYGLARSNVTEAVKPPRAPRQEARALTPEEARTVIAAAASDRLGAAIALLFVQGWRISEVLGLGWGDLDFAAGTARIRRAAVYVDGQGTVLGPPKTAGSHGLHHLAPGVLALLDRRRRIQQGERDGSSRWPQHTYGGEPVDLVFTTKNGDIVNRQAITSCSLARRRQPVSTPRD